jgi:hypothetical protein
MINLLLFLCRKLNYMIHLIKSTNIKIRTNETIYPRKLSAFA